MSSLRFGLLVACASLLSFSATVNAASTTYTYTGNTFAIASSPYTKSDSVSGSITLANALADNLTNFTTVSPTSFSFSAGTSTITNATATAGPVFAFKTDSNGDIFEWQVIVLIGSVSQFSISTNYYPSVYTPTDQVLKNGSFGQIQYNPGTWTVASVPEPETYAMIMAGLGLMGVVARRRKNKQA